MLVLEREEKEKIFLILSGTEQIELEVVEIRGTKKVRVGITAPKWVLIERDDMKKIGPQVA